MWKNFLPLLVAFLEIISKYFSKAYANAQIRGKVAKPFKKFVFSPQKGGVFPTFSTEAVKKLAKPLFFCCPNGRAPAAGAVGPPELATCRATRCARFPYVPLVGLSQAIPPDAFILRRPRNF